MLWKVLPANTTGSIIEYLPLGSNLKSYKEKELPTIDTASKCAKCDAYLDCFSLAGDNNLVTCIYCQQQNFYLKKDMHPFRYKTFLVKKSKIETLNFIIIDINLGKDNVLDIFRIIFESICHFFGKLLIFIFCGDISDIIYMGTQAAVHHQITTLNEFEDLLSLSLDWEKPPVSMCLENIYCLKQKCLLALEHRINFNNSKSEIFLSILLFASYFVDDLHKEVIVFTSEELNFSRMIKFPSKFKFFRPEQMMQNDLGRMLFQLLAKRPISFWFFVYSPHEIGLKNAFEFLLLKCKLFLYENFFEADKFEKIWGKYLEMSRKKISFGSMLSFNSTFSFEKASTRSFFSVDRKDETINLWQDNRRKLVVFDFKGSVKAQKIFIQFSHEVFLDAEKYLQVCTLETEMRNDPRNEVQNLNTTQIKLFLMLNFIERCLSSPEIAQEWLRNCLINLVKNELPIKNYCSLPSPNLLSLIEFCFHLNSWFLLMRGVGEDILLSTILNLPTLSEEDTITLVQPCLWIFKKKAINPTMVRAEESALREDGVYLLDRCDYLIIHSTSSQKSEELIIKAKKYASEIEEKRAFPTDIIFSTPGSLAERLFFSRLIKEREEDHILVCNHKNGKVKSELDLYFFNIFEMARKL